MENDTEKINVVRQYENYIATNIKSSNKDKLIYYFNLDTNYTDEISKLDLDTYDKKHMNVEKTFIY